MDPFTERLELPDGQYGVFRTRIGYAGNLAILTASEASKGSNIVFVDAVMRAFLIKATIRDFETGELLVNVEADGVDRGEPDTIETLMVKAFELYVAWKERAAPKVPEATEPETDEPETSRSSQPSERSKRKTKI